MGSEEDFDVSLDKVPEILESREEGFIWALALYALLYVFSYLPWDRRRTLMCL